MMNLRIKIMPGQMIEVKDVIDYKLEATGMFIDVQETTTKQVNGEAKDFMRVKKLWFNPSVLITYSEEYV